MLVSQFQKPNFLLTYLGAYQENSDTAIPLVNASVYDEFSTKDIALVRCDYDAKQVPEGPTVMRNLVRSYLENFDTIHTFNAESSSFDLNGHIARMKQQWLEEKR